MDFERMTHSVLFLKITDGSGSFRVEQRPTWGVGGNSALYQAVSDQYLEAWKKAVEECRQKGMPDPNKPVISIISKAEYDRIVFGESESRAPVKGETPETARRDAR